MTIQGVILTLFDYRYSKVIGGTVILTAMFFGLLLTIQVILENKLTFDFFQYLIIITYLNTVGMITFMGKLVVVIPEVEKSSATMIISLKHYLRKKKKGGTKDVCPISLACLLYTSPSPRDRQKYRMPSSA